MVVVNIPLRRGAHGRSRVVRGMVAPPPESRRQLKGMSGTYPLIAGHQTVSQSNAETTIATTDLQGYPHTETLPETTLRGGEGGAVGASG